MGTALVNKLYTQRGWHWGGGASIGFLGVASIIAVISGPHETGWIGWRGD